jgi:cbb3-type cytochrome oxidase maturation protein
MDILLLLIFVSVIFFGGAVLSFVYSVKSGEADHADRLALLPFRDPSTEPKERAS